MAEITRRGVIKGGTALAAAGSLGLLDWAKAWAETSPWKPEPGAKLSMLRWKYFVQAEDDAFLALLDAFDKATGVKVTVSREVLRRRAAEGFCCRQYRSWTRPLLGALYAASSLPGQMHRCHRRRRLSRQEIRRLGRQRSKIWQRRWHQVDRHPALLYGNSSQLPRFLVAKGRVLEIPRHDRRIYGIRQGHEEEQHPWRPRLRACFWRRQCLGALVPLGPWRQHVDKDDKVVINSPETAKALDYAKLLYDNMIPGVASWNDASNNKAFLSGDIHWTGNGISIYAAALKDPAKKEIADDMDHSVWPVGPDWPSDRVPPHVPAARYALHEISASL